MSYSIERVAVIGAGTMGAGIAAHVANAGFPVLLLDIAPRELAPEEEKKGLSLDHPAVRNRIVKSGLDRLKKSKPAAFMSRAAERLLEIGNLEDDFERLAEADWIVEVVIEKLDVKRALLERLEGIRRPGSLITTNTSGLPISAITEGRSEELKRCFFGTHFFNPPRYMKLLEIIAGEETDPAAIAALKEFAIRHLGKGVVDCRDTPNFIGNRILSVHGSFVMDYALEHGYTFEEVDAITGPLLGRPKTGTFRLQDLVGIDIAAHVAENLHGLIPDDPHRNILKSPRLAPLIGGMVERGWLGNKTRQGFYKKSKDAKGKSVFLVLDPETFEYREQRRPEFPAVEAVRKTPQLGERLSLLFNEHAEDRGAQLAWAVVSHFLGYAASCGPQIAFDLPSIDRAIRWGFSYEAGPFELWDQLGVAKTIERLEASGIEVADWVKTMLDNGCETFYRVENGQVTGYYDWQTDTYADIETDPRVIRVADLHRAGKVVKHNRSASLLDLGDGVLLLEFHAKMNAIDDDIVAMLEKARELLDDPAWIGLVVGNDGDNFCVGANLKQFLEGVAAGDLDVFHAGTERLQKALQALRYAPKPTTTAVHGMALGGGCEIAIGLARAVVAAESYIGLVEVGVGVIPAGGGLKELVARVISGPMRTPHTDPLPLVQKILETVAMAKVSTSAAEAEENGFLSVDDRIIMNRDHLLHEAKQEVLRMNAKGYVPPARLPLYAGGRDVLAALHMAIWSLEQAGWASPHDGLVARQVAQAISGGDASEPQWLDEDHFLALERQGFVDLIATEKTQARVEHMLKTGKPLRN